MRNNQIWFPNILSIENQMLGISLSTDLKKENENVISGKKKKKKIKRVNGKVLERYRRQLYRQDSGIFILNR